MKSKNEIKKNLSELEYLTSTEADSLLHWIGDKTEIEIKNEIHWIESFLTEPFPEIFKEPSRFVFYMFLKKKFLEWILE